MTLVFSSGEGARVSDDDPDGRTYAEVKIESDGRFRIDRLIPGRSYSCERIWRSKGNLSCPALKGLVLRAGEVRDLGDLRTTR